MDIGFVIIALPIILPAIFLLALIVASDGSNPFYTQRRIGRGGRIFKMFKLRTMVPNAHDLLAGHLANDACAHKEWSETQKLKKDPRITRLGCILRKSSLDELPQLLNVLIGDMSLVGPRPMLPEQQSLYPGDAYYKLRPGITGFWQISERNDSAFAQRAKFDAEYEKALSLKTDITVLGATVSVVLRGTGY